jgi:hypothetical protein
MKDDKNQYENDNVLTIEFQLLLLFLVFEEMKKNRKPKFKSFIHNISHSFKFALKNKNLSSSYLVIANPTNKLCILLLYL